MNINEAYRKGLIKIGEKIITNGNAWVAENADSVMITGVISHLMLGGFRITGKYHNISTGEKNNADGWFISYDNTKAYIKFIKESKKISPYAYWLIQNKL